MAPRAAFDAFFECIRNSSERTITMPLPRDVVLSQARGFEKEPSVARFGDMLHRERDQLRGHSTSRRATPPARHEPPSPKWVRPGALAEHAIYLSPPPARCLLSSCHRRRAQDETHHCSTAHARSHPSIGPNGKSGGLRAFRTTRLLLAPSRRLRMRGWSSQVLRRQVEPDLRVRLIFAAALMSMARNVD